MKITPRYYQDDAVEEVWEALRLGADPVVELPTGSGKALVIAMLAEKILAKQGRVLVLTHVQELVGQNALEFQNLTGVEPGILCAGLERTDKGHDVLFASVQSLYRPALKGEIPPFDLIMVDEAHLVADKDSDAKFYPAAFKAFPEARRVGLSATPSRMGVPIYGEGKYFSEKCYEVSVIELVKEKFLSPLIGVATAITLDLQKLKTTAGEYDAKSMEQQQTEDWLRAVAKSVKEKAEGRKHIGIFCPTVKTAEDCSRIFTEEGLDCRWVVGDTEDRGHLLDKWKAGEFRSMASVNVLSTGFNFKALDCIVVLRATKSSELWRQILGRATRIADGKDNALLLDFSGNLELHGGVCAGIDETFFEKKEGGYEKRSAAPNPARGAKKLQTGTKLSDLDPMLTSPKGAKLEIEDTAYIVIRSKTHTGKNLLMVTYKGKTEGGIYLDASEFVCVEYSGFAYTQAVKWFEKRGEASVPFSAEAARIKCFSLPVPRYITVRKSGKYLNVIGEEF